MLYNKCNKVDTLKYVSEEMGKVLQLQAEMTDDAFETSNKSYAEIREDYTKERVFWNEEAPNMIKIVDKEISSTENTIVNTRLFYPSDKALSPVIFYIHGGGMVVGNNDTHSRIMKILAIKSESIVIGIDYSLSPENVYPTAVKECYSVYKYYMEHAIEFGINESEVAFAGDSGGANLSMGTYLYIRDQGESVNNIKSLLLYYGAFGLTDSISMRKYGGAWDGLTEEDLNFYRKSYLGDTDISQAPYYNCYLNDLTQNMPPCFIVGAELDPLVDDSILLYSILKESNLDSEYVEYKGSIHAFLHYSRVMKDATDALERGAEFFKKRIK